MSEQKGGGSAFPNTRTGRQVVNGVELPGNITITEPGMTLRDYFAAKAMQGFIASPMFSSCAPEGVAIDAFEIADAMLAAREGGAQ